MPWSFPVWSSGNEARIAEFMTSQRWNEKWIGAGRQLAITCSIVDQVTWGRMTLGQNEFNATKSLARLTMGSPSLSDLSLVDE